MCELTSYTFNLIEKEFRNDNRLDCGFNIKIEKNPAYIIGTTNIYPKKDHINSFFGDISEFIEEKLKERLKEDGEVQISKILSGKNIDLGIKQANILDGRYFEIYCYKCFSIVFLRIWLEEGIYVKKKWISVDMDELLKTPWFSDK